MAESSAVFIDVNLIRVCGRIRRPHENRARLSRIYRYAIGRRLDSSRLESAFGCLQRLTVHVLTGNGVPIIGIGLQAFQSIEEQPVGIGAVRLGFA